jgi:hypothetical protein
VRPSRRRWLPVAAAVGLVGVVAALGPAPALAGPAGAVESGWWWRLRPSGAVPAPPGGEGLVVEGAPDGPVAVAAVRAAVGPVTAAVLRLRVVPGFEAAGDGAVIVACPAARPWQPVEAGPWDERPQPDCSVAATGLRAPDGSAFTFDLTGFPAPGGRLDVVLSPGRVSGPDGADGSVFALTFERPTPADVDVSPAAAPEPSGGAGGSPVASVDTDSVDLPTADLPGDAELPRLPDPSVGATLDLGPPPLPPTPPEAPRRAVSRVPSTASLAAAPNADGRNGRLWAALVLVAGLGALVWAASRPLPPPRRLVALGDRLPPPAAPAAPPVAGGLGRFRRPRHGPPPRLV